MALKNFDQIVEQAKSVQKPKTVVIAGADAENILAGGLYGSGGRLCISRPSGRGGEGGPHAGAAGVKDRPTA